MAQQTVIPDSVDWLGGPDQHPYLVVDVFTSRALEGNQLGVFLDGRPFSSEQMQQLAREMNFAETVFLLPPRRKQDPPSPWLGAHAGFKACLGRACRRYPGRKLFAQSGAIRTR